MPNVIEFAHRFSKLHGQDSAELLDVRPMEIDGTTACELLDYDTAYYEHCKGYGQTFSMKCHYPLEHGMYIQLVFLGNLRIPFCTFRGYSAEKEEWYKSRIGELFHVVVKEARNV